MSVHKYETAEGVRWYVSYTRPDKSRSKKRGFRTKSKALAWESANRADMARGVWIDERLSSVPLKEVGDRWIESKRGLKPVSFMMYESRYRVHVRPAFGDRPVSSIRYSEVQQWISDLRDSNGKLLSARTRQAVLSILRLILDDCVRDGRIAANPAAGISIKNNAPSRMIFLTYRELHALAAASGKYETFILFAGYTGLRFGEICALAPEDIDFERGRVNVCKNAVWIGSKVHVGTPKNSKRRSVAYPAFLTPRLKLAARTARGNHLFPGRDGGYMRRPGTTSWFAKAKKESGVDPALTFHDLRHTAASLAIRSGANVKVVQEMLGHASAALTLDTYAGLFNDNLDEVAARMDSNVRDLGLA